MSLETDLTSLIDTLLTKKPNDDCNTNVVTIMSIIYSWCF